MQFNSLAYLSGRSSPRPSARIKRMEPLVKRCWAGLCTTLFYRGNLPASSAANRCSPSFCRTELCSGTALHPPRQCASPNCCGHELPCNSIRLCNFFASSLSSKRQRESNVWKLCRTALCAGNWVLYDLIASGSKLSA